MGRTLDGRKLVVRRAKSNEHEWLYRNQAEFLEPYQLVESPLRKEWPCFVLLDGKKIIGFRSFEFHDDGERVNAWVGRTCLKKGYEGKGLGTFLNGRANAMLIARGFKEVRTHAYNPRAKAFWTRLGYERTSGATLTERGNTGFKLDLTKLKKQKRPARK